MKNCTCVLWIQRKPLIEFQENNEVKKKRLPEILVKAMMNLYEGSKTEVKIGSEFPEEFYVAVGVHQGSVL